MGRRKTCHLFICFIFMSNFESSPELLPDGVVGDGVQEDDVSGDGHVHREVVFHVLQHCIASHAGPLGVKVKNRRLEFFWVENLPIGVFYLGQHHSSVQDVITDGLIVLALNIVNRENIENNYERYFLPTQIQASWTPSICSMQSSTSDGPNHFE